MLARVLRPLKRIRKNPCSCRGFADQHYTNEAAQRNFVEESHLKKIGNREIVGFGMNSMPTYIDDENFPFPAIRYRECTPELMALRETKERGDWRKLTVEEKKYLYRSSFRQTFSEFQSPNSDWKNILGSLLLFLSFTLWIYLFIHRYVYPDAPASFSKEARIAQYYRQVAINNQPFTGNYRPPGAELRVHPKNRKELKAIKAAERAESESSCD